MTTKKKKAKPQEQLLRGVPLQIEVLLLKNRVAKLESFCGMMFAMWSAGRSAEYAAMAQELAKAGSTKLPTLQELMKTAAAVEKLEREG
jgi:hypothetical protein